MKVVKYSNKPIDKVLVVETKVEEDKKEVKEEQ
jgi:hypothetical protein